MLRTKVLIIGGGPAGSTAARFLAKEGIDTILLERNFSFVKPCGGGIPDAVFDELGIPRNIIKKDVKNIKLVSPLNNAVDIRLEGGFIAIVKRGEFDSLLREDAKVKGAQLIEAGFNHFEEAGKQITARVNINGEEEQIRTDYLIAADGVNSRVRLALGLKLSSAVYTLTTKIKNDNADTCEFWFGESHARKSYSWIFPEAEGISAGTGSSDPGELKGMLKAFFGRRGLNADYTATSLNADYTATRMYKVPLWSGELYNKDNILFIGDAAGQVMPLTYEGIYYAMKAGEFAAMAIIAGKPSDYKKLWRKRFNSRFMIMRKLCDYFLRDDNSAEKFVSLCRRHEIQAATMKLWLEKSSDGRKLISFANFFRKVLN
ncbi:MAG: NAD(P)/FAD-dependent oxidoreductase [Thermodesulfovibrionales bacterium]|nr:NAD(P)/FAD-dependent oxidoreductase [Thermodesulfovibrionales bacterium]